MAAPSTVAEQLRVRARALRVLAQVIDDCGAITLYRRAGIDTWIGPTPQRCLDDLVAARTQLQRSADDLRCAAHRLEVRAEQTDIAAARLLTSQMGRL